MNEIKGYLRDFRIDVPQVIYDCPGIKIFGRVIKSIVFSTDVSIIRNCNADAVIAVYPFTPQPVITQAVMLAADCPVFVGVGNSPYALFFVTVLFDRLLPPSVSKIIAPDALKLAEYCCENWFKLKRYNITEEAYQELRFLSRQYNNQVAIKIKLKNIKLIFYFYANITHN